MPERWATITFLLLAGVSIGRRSPVKSATIAKLHDSESLGAVRSVYTYFMVLGTALRPMLFGYLLDAGFGFPFILLGAASLLGLASVNSLRVHPIFSD